MESVNELKTPSANRDDLSIEELKASSDQECLNEEQAANRIASLKELSILLYYYATRVQQQRHSNDNQPIIRKLAHKKAA